MKLTSLNNLEEKGERVEGVWKLGENHELVYREGEGKREARLKGTLVAVERGALVFSATVKEDEKRSTTGLFKLTGDWRVDSKNRILFEVEKAAGKKDRLVFQGQWELGPNYEIIYSYGQTRLKTKTKVTQTLVFKGHWDLTERNRLAFQVEGDTDSTLRFRGAFQTKSLLAKAGEIRYQIGIEIEGRKKLQTLTFFGKWKISKALELSFEMEYGGGEKRALTFAGTYHINEDTSVTAELQARNGKPLGMEVHFRREFFQNQGELFLRLRRTAEESAAEAGVRVPW
jgi:hypothetical protein